MVVVQLSIGGQYLTDLTTCAQSRLVIVCGPFIVLMNAVFLRWFEAGDYCDSVVMLLQRNFVILSWHL